MIQYIHFNVLIEVCYMLIRDRSKMFRESISKLDRYREALNSKKRERSDLSSERGGGVNLTKMGSQIHKISDDNMTQREVKTSNSMLNKRTRTLVADTRVSLTLFVTTVLFLVCIIQDAVY